MSHDCRRSIKLYVVICKGFVDKDTSAISIEYLVL